MSVEVITCNEQEPRFMKKLLSLGQSAVAARNPLSVELQAFIHEPYEVVHPRENGSIDQIAQDFFKVIREYPDVNWTHMSLRVSPRGRRIISKSAFESVFGVFTDQKPNMFGAEYVTPDVSGKFVHCVLEEAQCKYREAYPDKQDYENGLIPLLLSEQFAFALNLAKGNILHAVLAAHFGSRAIARGSDEISGLKFTPEEMVAWRQCVASMAEVNQAEGRSGSVNNTGDNYHFFGAMAGGLINSYVNKPRDIVCNMGYTFVHTHGERLTRFFDHSPNLITHGPADRAGFEIGKHIAGLMGDKVRLLGSRELGFRL